jgi:spermidine/putrescine-binding protein
MIHASAIGRRQLTAGLGLAGAGLALGMPHVARAAGGSVTFFTFPTYSDPKLVGDFARQTGIELKTQNAVDTDPMIAKLMSTRGEGFDVVSISNQLAPQLMQEGLLEPVEIGRLKNWSNLYPAFRDAKFIATDKPGFVAGIPMVWGYDGVIYRTDKVASADSWADLWDPRYKGRIGAVDFGYQMVLIAAQVLGMDETLKRNPIDFSEAQYAQIKAKLIAQKPLLDKYWSSTAEGGTLLASGEIWISLGKLAMLQILKNEGVTARLISPKEGAQGWSNICSILKTSPNKDAAYAFLDYISGPSFQSPLVTVKGYPSVNRLVMEAQPQAARDNLLLGNPKLTETLVWWGRAKNPQRINNLWNEVKAA